MKKLLSLVFVLGFVSQVLAVDNERRILGAYNKTDKAYDLECYFVSPNKNLLILPVTTSTFINNTITRDFVVKLNSVDTDMRVSFLQKTSGDRKSVGRYNVSLGIENYSGNIENNFSKGMYLENSGSDFDNTYEVNKLYCTFSVARTTPYQLDNSINDLHINVHPHQSYDSFNETTENVQRILDENVGSNIVLIEEKNNNKGQLVDLTRFLETGIVPDLPKSPFSTPIDVPLTTELIISPAGHNRYELTKKNGEINITYTGGFHNYCVWNNARNIIRSLLRSESNTKLSINYKLDSMIVQKSGIIGGLSFKRSQIKNTKLLSNLIKNDPSYMKNYFNNYFQYFTGSFLTGASWGSFTSTFKTMKMNLKSPLGEDSVVINGQGLRDLEIDFNYL